MPKNTKASNIVKISGVMPYAVTITNTNTSATATLYPSNMGGRIANVAKAFEFYRFTHFTWEFPPQSRYETTLSIGNLSSAGWAAFGFDPELTNAVATTVAVTSVLTLSKSKSLMYNIVNVNTNDASGTGTLMTPGNSGFTKLTVGRKFLLSVPLKWYRNSAVTSFDTDFVQGTFIFAVADAAGATTVNLSGLLRYEVEFTGPVDFTNITKPVVSLAERLAALELRNFVLEERVRVLTERERQEEKEYNSYVGVEEVDQASVSLTPGLVRSSPVDLNSNGGTNPKGIMEPVVDLNFVGPMTATKLP
jgi:hypothetical protein